MQLLQTALVLCSLRRASPVPFINQLCGFLGCFLWHCMCNRCLLCRWLDQFTVALDALSRHRLRIAEPRNRFACWLPIGHLRYALTAQLA